MIKTVTGARFNSPSKFSRPTTMSLVLQKAGLLTDLPAVVDFHNIAVIRNRHDNLNQRGSTRRAF